LNRQKFISVSNCIDFLLEYAKKNLLKNNPFIFLAIDEFKTLHEKYPNCFERVWNDLKLCLDRKQIGLLISILDDSKIVPIKRPIYWIKLPSLNIQDTFALISTCEWTISHTQLATYLLSVCGGHPRTFQLLYKVIKKSRSDLSYKDLKDKFRKELDKRQLLKLAKLGESDLEALISATVIGKKVQLSGYLGTYQVRNRINQILIIFF